MKVGKYRITFHPTWITRLFLIVLGAVTLLFLTAFLVEFGLAGMKGILSMVERWIV